MEKKLIEEIRKRRSVRNYREDEIPENILKEIVQTGRYAPSGMNRQDFQITVIRNREIQKNLIEAMGKALKDVDYNGFYSAPCYILISAPEGNSNGISDCACVAMNMMTAAYIEGLGSVWVNQLKNRCHDEGIRKVLTTAEIPSDHVVWSALAMGYAAENKPEDRENSSKAVYV